MVEATEFEEARYSLMLMTFLVVVVVSAALIAGALWGIYGKLSAKTEGFVIALAGGALVVSLVSEMIQPAIEQSNLWVGLGAVAAGAVVFSVVDYWIDEKWGADGGGGLLAAITLDGVPENLALGVALIGAAPIDVAALAGSILLSNLPEAAGGAKQMVGGGRGDYRQYRAGRRVSASAGRDPLFCCWGGGCLAGDRGVSQSL